MIAFTKQERRFKQIWLEIFNLCYINHRKNKVKITCSGMDVKW